MLSTACRNKKEGRIRSRYEFALYSAWFSGICRAAGGGSPYTVYSSAILTAVSSAISISSEKRHKVMGLRRLAPSTDGVLLPLKIEPASLGFDFDIYLSCSAIFTAVSSAISIIWVKLLWRSSAVRLSSGR